MNRKYFELIAFVVIASLVIARVIYHAIPSYVPFASVGVYFFIKYVIMKDKDDDDQENEAGEG